jgi:hypothetical protein
MLLVMVLAAAVVVVVVVFILYRHAQRVRPAFLNIFLLVRYENRTLKKNKLKET